MPSSIDPNTELARITLAERIQQITDRASLLGQVRQSMEAEQQRVNAETQVTETEQKSRHVDTEMKRRNPFMGKRARRATTEEEEASQPEEEPIEGEHTNEGTHLDIQA